MENTLVAFRHNKLILTAPDIYRAVYLFKLVEPKSLKRYELEQTPIHYDPDP